MDVVLDNESIVQWNIRVFEHRNDDQFVLHHERIPELAVPLDQVRDALSAHFTFLEEGDTNGGPARDDATRALFVLRLRSS